jgi:hypothetical protein
MKLSTLTDWIRGRSNGSPPVGTTHVLAHLPSFLLGPPGCGDVGWWEIQTLANHEAGTPASDSPDLDGPAAMDAMDLCSFAGDALGCTLTFTRFDVEIWSPSDATWVTEPAYYLIPSGGDR